MGLCLFILFVIGNSKKPRSRLKSFISYPYPPGKAYMILGDPKMDESLKNGNSWYSDHFEDIFLSKYASFCHISTIDDSNELTSHLKCIGLHHYQLGNDYVTLGHPKMDGSLKNSKSWNFDPIWWQFGIRWGYFFSY